MKNQYKLTLILLTLVSCSKQEPELMAENEIVVEEELFNPTDGIVIAKSEFVGGSYANETQGTTSDCEGGVGIGITVESAMSDSSYIFNRNQSPCKAAEVVFDGTQDIFARAADPSIDIIFNDKYGKLPKTHNIEKQAKTATVLSDVSLEYSANSALASKPYAQMGMFKADYDKLRKEKDKNLQQERLEELVQDDILKAKEKMLAEVRAERRKEVETQHQDLIVENKKLENKNGLTTRYVAKLSDDLVKKSTEIIDLESEVASLKLAKEVEGNSYEEKLELLEKRVEDFAQLSLELKRQNEKLALLAKGANEKIATDLTNAENQAEQARYAAMLNVAQNVATDEQLAKALETSQKKALQRKAQRLQTQADSLAYHAQKDEVFNKDMQKVYRELQNNMQPAYEGKIARVVGVELNKEPTLADVQLLLAEKDRSLNEILGEILMDIQPMVGTWKLDWKLASHNLQIKTESWNISAETTLYDFFDYIKEKVEEIHGIKLSIQQYPETRKIVITDQF